MTFDDMDVEPREFDGSAVLRLGLMEPTEAWDCDPFTRLSADPYDLELDEEDSESDWQVLALDRFGDRMVNANW